MILITGATGLVGSHLLFQLIEAGENCKALYRSEHKIKLVEKLFTSVNGKTSQGVMNDLASSAIEFNDTIGAPLLSVAVLKAILRVFKNTAIS